jgi:hypothetical protein
MAIKAGAARPWDNRQHTLDTWYEPYTTETELSRNIRFVLSVPGIQAFCTPGDLTILPSVLKIANEAHMMSGDEIDAAMADVASEPHIFPMPALG